MSETVTGYLRRLPPDIDQLRDLVGQALDQQGDPSRHYTISAALTVAQKLLEDLQRAEVAARPEGA